MAIANTRQRQPQRQPAQRPTATGGLTRRPTPAAPGAPSTPPGGRRQPQPPPGPPGGGRPLTGLLPQRPVGLPTQLGAQGGVSGASQGGAGVQPGGGMGTPPGNPYQRALQNVLVAGGQMAGGLAAPGLGPLAGLALTGAGLAAGAGGPARGMIGAAGSVPPGMMLGAAGQGGMIPQMGGNPAPFSPPPMAPPGGGIPGGPTRQGLINSALQRGAGMGQGAGAAMQAGMAGVGAGGPQMLNVTPPPGMPGMGGGGFGPFGSVDQWAAQFAAEHGGRQPNEQDMQDALSSFDFLAQTGRPPTEREWLQRYYRGFWPGGETEAGGALYNQQFGGGMPQMGMPQMGAPTPPGWFPPMALPQTGYNFTF